MPDLVNKKRYLDLGASGVVLVRGIIKKKASFNTLVMEYFVSYGVRRGHEVKIHLAFLNVVCLNWESTET